MFIRKAERKKAKLRLGISGPSGGGKTWSALEIAHGMGGKIGMIDTESGRGELYAGCRSKYDNNIIFEYDVIRLDAPYSPERYIEALKTFEKNGYDIVIIDSLSHAWSGEGGILSIVDKAGGQFQNGWKVGTPKQNSLVDGLITSKLHIIANMRAKTEYVMEKDDRGKTAPRKIGLAPIQRDQVEYEFTVFMNMSHDNIAHVSKDNSDLYNLEFIKPSPEMGKKLMEWLNTGVDVKPEIDPQEHFMEEILPVIIYDFSECKTQDELRDKFLDATRKYKEGYAIDAIINAKDERKKSIKDEEIIKEEPVNVPVVTTAYKNSQALTQLTQGAM